MEPIKKPPDWPGAWFWKILALVGTLASVASLVKDIVESMTK